MEVSHHSADNSLFKIHPEKLASNSYVSITQMITVLGLTALSILVGYITFVGVANSQGYVDHSSDWVNYNVRCQNSPQCYQAQQDRLLTPEGYWINHTADRWIPGLEPAWKAMLAVVLLQPSLGYMAFRIYNAYQRGRNNSSLHAEGCIISAVDVPKTSLKPSTGDFEFSYQK